ncbi:hypothetical protein MGA5115_03536 [Marinomonas gallaica]|uniref:Uncharacterized protein n=1 Tax=Marinomonas gallaica TaxID=1806667 RepID=A0A1C3JW67_9GAMM|nr:MULTISPECIES: hypothetical protein [Marinomonas]MCO4785344.1 hypothetical protein [Marinomonas atlantica]SBT19372.1 hypothetical protein MGA5115_03536 [Marinomonas gallaica]SBT22952.1 hypothetical protein MGA5116_03584 [Marinomonas gallaica]
MFEFALFFAAIAGAFWMAHSLVKQVSRPTMKAQPIKIETEKKAHPRRQNRFPD